MKNIHLFCNAHIDPVWLWRWQEGAAEAISTFRCAADFCDEFEVVEGTVLGIGNGNPNSHHLDTSRKLEFFNSRAQVIVQGKIKIRCRNFEAEV